MKTMKNLAAMCLIATGTMTMNAQNVGISATGTPPDPAAMLHVDGTTGLSSGTQKGVLIPTVALTSATVAAPVGPTPLPQSLVVYNTNTSMANGNGPGFYYWNGSKWVYLAAPANGPGSAGQVLTSQGANNPPQWSTLSVGGGCAGSVQMISNVSSTTMDWRTCANYCATLTEGGYSDWRMPTTQDIVSYMSNWDNVKNSSGVLLSSQPNYNGYIWVGEFYSALGYWIVFSEFTGHWSNNTYNDTNTGSCRCVR